MKIKNFMVETNKKLKKHNYNTQTIMEEVKLAASMMDVLNNKNLNPDIIEDEDFGITYYKVDKTGNPEDDWAELKKMDLIVIKTAVKPTVGIYKRRTPGLGGFVFDVLVPVGNSYKIDETSFGESFLYWSWNSIDIYSPSKQPVYDKPPKDGSEYLEESAKYFKMDRNTVVDTTDNTVYSWLPLSDLPEDEMYEELKKVQKGDVIFAEFNGEKDYYKINSPIKKDSYVYIDSGHWSDYQILSSSIVGMINRYEAKIFIRNEDYDLSHGEKLKDTGEDWDEQLNESPRIPTLRRNGVAYHQVNSANIFDEEALYDMLIPNKTLINVSNELSIMSNDYHQFTVGKYEVIGKVNSPKRVYLKKTTLSRAHWYNLNKIFSAIESGDATLWYPTEKADYTNSTNILTDMGDDWIEESVDPDYEPLNERVQRGTYLRRHGVTYHKVDTNYIFDADTLYDMVKVNNTLLAGGSIKYEVIGKWIGHDGTGYINIKKTTSMNDSTFTSKELFRQIENGYLTLWLPVGKAEAQSRPLDFDGSEFDEFDESYKPLKEDWQEQDEPGVGIIEYQGHKYYKVDSERHLHKNTDLMKYLVKDMTIFKGIPNGKELIYKGWEPQKCCGYKLNDDPYVLNLKIDGDDRDFDFSFVGMYGMITQVDPLFAIYIPEALAERTGIKDEWELTTGDEFDESVNLKGEELETLKEGMRIVGKKTMTILNKKGNHYNVLSEGKKYKYDIDNLKYDYSHKKVKIYSKD